VTAPEQVVIASNELEAILLPGIGGRLHRLRVAGHDLMRTPPTLDLYQTETFFWGGYVMAPWCNRVGTAPARFGGRTIQLTPNFSDGTAIHGQVYAAAWRQESEDTFAVEAGGQGWPWRYRVEHTLAVEGLTLRQELRLTNTDDADMPAGIGLHPWFSGSPLVRIAAEKTYESNSEPAINPVAVAGIHDMRLMRELTPGIDATWTDLSQPQVELAWPDLGLSARMRTNATHIVAAHAVDRGAIAVEPQTHAPQGLDRLIRGEPGALSVLGSGQTLELTIELTFWSLDTEPEH
jgi:aldose 1-epimerase